MALPMLWALLPRPNTAMLLTEPLSLLTAIALLELNEFERLAVALLPLLAAAVP